MQDEEQKGPVNYFELACELVFLGTLTVAVYIGGVLLLGEPINRHMPIWFLNPLSFFSISALLAGWMVGMKFWKPKSLTIKIIKKILCVFVLALLASILTHWLMIKTMREILH